MVRNIAIVEDEDDAVTLLNGLIKKFSEATGQEFRVDRYRSAVEFLTDYKRIYAVVLMDIQMPYKDGMSAAIELRNIDKTVSIIFVTNLIQYAQRGYEVDAVAYLVKPVKYYDFELKMRKALDVYVMNERHDLTINTSGGLCRISTDKLMYVEIVRHRLYYHLVDSVVEMTGVLSQVEEKLKEFGFLRCNQCYLVNPRFVVSVKKSSVRVGRETLTISRARRNSFMAELANWYAGTERDS